MGILMGNQARQPMISKTLCPQGHHLSAWRRGSEERLPQLNWKHEDYHSRAIHQHQISHSRASCKAQEVLLRLPRLSLVQIHASNGHRRETRRPKAKLLPTILAVLTRTPHAPECPAGFRQLLEPCGIPSTEEPDKTKTGLLLCPPFPQTTVSSSVTPGIKEMPRESDDRCLFPHRKDSTTPLRCPTTSPCIRGLTQHSPEAGPAVAAAPRAITAPAQAAISPALPPTCK
jgi:hypothetical protein